jgi:hypothetical protein
MRNSFAACPPSTCGETLMAQDTDDILREVTSKEYAYGFVTDIESELAPKGLNEDIVRYISAKKNEPEWLLQWRLEAFRGWLKPWRNRNGPC